MRWLFENWLVLLPVGGMAATHLFGHGHGGHGRRCHGHDARGHRDTAGRSDNSHCGPRTRVPADEATAPELQPVERNRQV